MSDEPSGLRSTRGLLMTEPVAYLTMACFSDQTPAAPEPVALRTTNRVR